MVTSSRHFLLAFGILPVLVSLIVAWSCASSNAGDFNSTLYAQSKPSTDEQSSDSVEDLIEVIEALSGWHFDRANLDKSHPKFKQIIEQHFDALESYLEQDLSLVDADITIRIKNEPNHGHGGMATERQVHADGSTTITYYNPGE